MGFLRKVGRKIKKGVKKLFSTKLGSLLGGIAISMMLGPVLGRAWNGLKGAFAGTGATAGQAATQAASQAASQAATEVAKQATTSLVADAGTKLTTEQIEQIVSGETLQSIASKEVAGKALTEKAVRSSMSTAIQNGNALDFTNILSQGTSSGTIPLNISETVTGSLNDINKYIETGDMFTPEVSKTIEANKQIIEMESPKLFGDKKLGADIKENFTDFGTNVKDTVKDPSSLFGDEFIPDTVETVARTMTLDAVMGEEVDEGGYGNDPAASLGMQGPQDSYVAQVRNQIPNTPAINMQQMNQGLFFGTLSPQFLSQQQQYYS